MPRLVGENKEIKH